MTSTFRQTGKNMDTKKFLYALNNLNEKQRSVVEAKENKVLINAGAGSGKTTTVVLKVCKLAYLRNPLSNVLVITFTRKAAEEVKDKLKSYDAFPSVSTIHSFCLEIFRKHGGKIGYSQNFSFISDEEKAEVLKNILDSAGYKKSSAKFAKNLSSVYYSDTTEERRIMMEYVSFLKENSLMDLEILQEITLDILNAHEDVCQEVRNEYKYVFVDEAQDTSNVQFEILRRLNFENELFIGDDKQGIYSFRNADLKHYISMTKGDYKLYGLDINYRCPREVVDYGNSLIKLNRNQIPMEIVTLKEPEQAIEILEESPVERIKEIPETETIGILFRDNQSLNQFIFQNKGRIDYEEETVFSKDKELSAIFSLIRAALNKTDFSMSGILAKYHPNNIKELKDRAITESKPLIELLPDELIEKIVKTESFIPITNGIECLKEVSILLYGMEIPILGKFMEMLTELKMENGSILDLQYIFYNKVQVRKENRINILTVHRSKGLEFDHVFLMNMNKGEFPLPYEEKSEEAVRLAYVAVTRTRKRLYLCTSKEKTDSVYLTNYKESTNMWRNT